MLNRFTKLYRAKTVYVKQLSEDNWVVFVPDKFGLPFVVSKPVINLLNAFAIGITVDAILQENKQNNAISHKECLACIAALYKYGALREIQTKPIYSAQSLQSIETIDALSIWLHVTNACNLNCSYCFVHKDNSKMSAEVMRKIVSDITYTAEKRAIKSVTIKFAGGEPTLNLQGMQLFYDLLQKKAENFITQFGVITNGTILTKEVLEFFKRPNVTVSLSLDGYGSSGHNIHRTFKETGNGSWNIIQKNVETLLANKIKPSILATISEESCNTLCDLVKWVFANDLFTRLSVVRTSNNSKNFTHNMINAFEETLRELEHPKYFINLQKGLSICYLGFESPSFSTRCAIGTNYLVIDQNGKIASCPMIIHKATTQYDRDLLLAIRNSITFDPSKRNSKKCLHCQWFPVCVGDCPIHNNETCGSPFGTSSLHDFYQYIIPRYINFCGIKILQQAKKKQIFKYHILSI